MRERGLVDDRQAPALASEASAPTLTRMVQILRAGGLTLEEVEEFRAEIELLYSDRGITREQARQVQEQLPRPGTPALSEPERARQLEALAKLCEIGALSEDDFQTEKTRILALPISP